jgi:hypothetical protein
MTTEELVVAGLLVAVLPIGAIEAVGYTRGRYLSEFWRLGMDEKLDQIAEHRREWRTMGISWLAIVVTTTAGIGGMAAILISDGQAVPATIGLAIFTVAAGGWMVGLAVQVGGVGVASDQRRDGGVTPSWVEGVWQVAFVTESVWVIASGLAYVALGIAILGGTVLPAWSGWAAIAVGVVIPVIAMATREMFPHMALLGPLVLVVGLLAS